MSYTELGILGVALAIIIDVYILRTRILRRKAFWLSYVIIVGFQLLTNGILTGFRIVRYNGEHIIGKSTPVDSAPPFYGDGRIAFAPIEDLLFGFALVVLTLATWVWLGRRQVQRTPMAGPPMDIAARYLWRNK